MGWEKGWRRLTRRCAAPAQLAAALLHLLAPLATAQVPTDPVGTTAAATPWWWEAPRELGGTWTRSAGEFGTSALQGAGTVGHRVGQEVGGAAGQVVDDVVEGRLRWVIGPAKDAIAVTPQLHTAARNSRDAFRHAREVRRQEALLRRYLPRPPEGYRPSIPTGRLVARQLATPFQPANVAMTLGLTFAGGLVVAAQDEDYTWKDAVRSVGDRSLWTAIVTSGLGYTVASLAAAALIPAGGTLFPMVAPMIVGTVGAIVGWILGERLGSGDSLREAWGSLEFPAILGLSIGASMGLLVGVALGAAIGGPLGGIVATVGAIAGTLLFRKLGLRAGQLVAESLGLGEVDDPEAAPEASVAPTGATTAPVPGPAAATRAALYTRLVEALEDGDRGRAAALHRAMGAAVPALATED